MISISQAPQWLLDIALNEVREEPPPRPVLSIVRDNHDVATDQQTKYVRSGFMREIEALRGLQPGSQSNELNKAAFKIGTLVGTGFLSRDEAEQTLLDVALSFPNQTGREPWNHKNAMEQITSGLNAGIKKPRQLPEPKKSVLIRGGAVRAYIKRTTEVLEDDESSDASDTDEQAINEGIYAVLNGRTVLAVQKTKGKETGSEENTSRHFVCDFAAYISGEVRDENGAAIYEVDGLTRRGRVFQVELLAAKMSDPKYVAGQFLNACGAGTIVYAGMEKHIAPAVHQFTDFSRLRISRRFSRVGWTKDLKEFIIPGIEPPDVTMTLSKELAFRVLTEGDVQEPLDALLSAHKPELTTVALVHALLAPFAALAEWRDDKFALFIAGRTGSFKTSWAAMLMCIYGDFANEDRLLKFGMGGTTNAMMSYMADVSDLPLLVDNFKPGTGNGQKDAQSLIHGVLEGGERKRLNRDGTRREGKEIHCWPIFTGEDTIEDAASIARMLVVPARWDGDANEGLTKVQGMSHMLPAIGGTWLTWLLTDEAKIIADYVAKKFPGRRAHWASYLRSSCPDMVNANRVASSLALCECGWEAAQACPEFAPVLSRYTVVFNESLRAIGLNMGMYTAQTHEANKYLAAIRAMLTTNRAYTMHYASDYDPEDRRVFLGWHDDKTLYLQPEATFTEVSKFMRDGGGLNGVGAATIHKQLDQLGHLAKKDKGHFAVLKRVGTERKTMRLLWIKKEAVFELANDDENEDEESL